MKYRVYHQKYKYDEYLSATELGDIVIFIDEDIYEDLDDPELATIERCSEVKDIHGKLIYENDIVSYEFNGEKHENQLVAYCEKTASFKFGKRSLADTFNYLTVNGIHGIMKTFEVTGNAHDNN